MGRPPGRRLKQFFYRELLPELKARGKALLVISHDEHYFEAADRVLRLDGGLIREVDGVAMVGGPPDRGCAIGRIGPHQTMTSTSSIAPEGRGSP